LVSKHHRWYSAAETCELESVVLDLYTGNGMQFPRHQCFIQLMGDRNIILAVKVQTSRFPDLEKEPLFFRMYSNAYLQSVRSAGVFSPFKVEGITVTGSQQLLTFAQRFKDLQALEGHTVLFLNGRQIDHVTPGRIVNGDVLELVYDSTISQVIDWPVADLQTFDSDLDHLRKYLLHHAQQTHQTIDYRDDLDIWLLKKDLVGGFEGVYYHKNQGNAVRMVTHQDYAVPVPYVVGFATQVPGWGNIKD